jgi:hypothetical protein
LEEIVELIEENISDERVAGIVAIIQHQPSKTKQKELKNVSAVCIIRVKYVMWFRVLYAAHT